MPVETFTGQIIQGPYTFTPAGYLPCEGQLVSIAEYDTLFVLLGTTYGGDGQTTFGLPDLRGRAPLGAGAGAGLSNQPLGQAAGAETVALSATQMPAHTHGVAASFTAGDQASPAGAVLAPDGAAGTAPYKTSASGTNGSLAATAVGLTGGGAGHENMPPFLGSRFFIATFGIFPSQN